MDTPLQRIEVIDDTGIAYSRWVVRVSITEVDKDFIQVVVTQIPESVILPDYDPYKDA